MNSRLHSQDSRPHRTWMRVAALMLALLIVLVVGIAIGRMIDSDQQAPGANSGRSAGPGPTDELDGVPLGYGRSEEGAVSAAANFTLAQRVCAHDLDECLSVMRTIAAPEWRTQAERQARNGLDFVSERFGAGASVSSSLLRFRVTSFSRKTASIEFWGVTVFAGPKRPSGESVWGILKIDLSWIDDDWRVVGQDTSPGPSPIVLESAEDAEALESVMEDFREFSDAPAP